jgi:hypothetical protein
LTGGLLFAGRRLCAPYPLDAQSWCVGYGIATVTVLKVMAGTVTVTPLLISMILFAAKVIFPVADPLPVTVSSTAAPSSDSVTPVMVLGKVQEVAAGVPSNAVLADRPVMLVATGLLVVIVPLTVGEAVNKARSAASAVIAAATSPVLFPAPGAL